MIDRRTNLPTALRAVARWERLGAGAVPAMLAHPHWDGPAASPAPAVPVVIWMHGRTAYKEIDPGRYLRLVRAGLAVCALDLPGHGERLEAGLQLPERTLDVVLRMIGEIDGVVDALGRIDGFDVGRLGIGGMSAGGMATLSRLCRAHPFRCASVEATTGSWEHQQDREMFHGQPRARYADRNPIDHLAGWRPIPFQAFHSRRDEWVSFDGQQTFVTALEDRYADAIATDLPIDFVVYEETGAPYEHAGFGRRSADAKNRQRDFFVEHLVGEGTEGLRD